MFLRLPKVGLSFAIELLEDHGFQISDGVCKQV